ncbi:MAG: HD domain-containing protein [Bdellovibrionales bacterium]|nr:HD domain-containing protein [Bdellovibrionales bacterium]
MESQKKRFEDIRVLYVDDEQDNLTSFELHLEDEFNIATFNDPRKALKVALEDPSVGVLIVDQVMPHMTGLDLAVKVKKIKPYMTCIMITGNATKQLAIESVRNRVFYEFLEKPVNFSSNEIKQIVIAGLSETILHKTKSEFRFGTLELLATLIDDKDGHTHRHSQRVTEWAMKIASKFNFDERELMLIKEGAMIHDIGKISIPDDILKKPGRLTSLERKIIMTHPSRGGDIIDKIPQLKELSTMARDHHERPDGQGYPRGLKGEEIPLMTQIVALADFFEALSSKRPYKDPWEIRDIVREINTVKGSQFRDDVVNALFVVLQEEKLISHDEIEAVTNEQAA